MDNKSQVDMSLAVACCKEHYKNDIDAFILFSSDSDYRALIFALDDAGFLVMYEDEKALTDTRLEYTKQDHNNYFRKYLKNIRVKIKEDGSLYFEIG